MGDATLEQAVELLNDAKLASDSSAKVDLLKGLLELVIKKAPAALIPVLLPDILELQVDPAAAVRKLLPEVVEGAASALPTALVVQQGLQCLERLVGDAVPAIAKRATQACTPLFKAGFVLVARYGNDAGQATALQQLWQAAQGAKASVAAVAAAHGNDGVRLAAIKFAEQSILLLTADTLPALPGLHPAGPAPFLDNQVLARSAAVRDAEAALVELVALLKRLLSHADAPGPASVGLVRAAGSVALQRPQFVGKLLPSLLALANSGAYKVDAADNSVQSSVASALAAALVALQKSQHATAQAWRKKMADALRAMDSGAAQEAQRSRASPAADEDQQAAKKARTDWQQPGGAAGAQPTPVPGPAQPAAVPPLAVPPLAALPPPRLPVPVPQAPAGGPPGGQQGASAGPASTEPAATSREDLVQAQATAHALIASQDAAGLAALIGGLQPAVLADLVLSNMALLPRRHELPPDQAPLAAWLGALTELLGAPPGAQQQHPAADAAAMLPGHFGQPAAHGDAGSKPVKDDVKLPKAAAPLRLPASAFAFRLEPVPLTQQQKAELQREAVLRILRTEKTAARELQIALVARLASEPAAMAGRDSIADSVLQYVLGDFEGRGGFELMLHWLHVLFGVCCGSLASSRLGPLSGLKSEDGAALIDNDEHGRLDASAFSIGAAPAMAELSGSHYDRILLALLKGLQEALPASDRTINKILMEVPAIPTPSVRQFLEQLCGSGPDWSTLALLAARDLLLQRPPCRAEMLGLVLEATNAGDLDLRTKAVRLTVNRLFGEASISASIEAHALQRLDDMLAADGMEGHAAPDEGAGPPPAEEGDGAGGAAPAEPGEEHYAKLCTLYCALCTKKQPMLPHLLEVYGQAPEGGRAAIRSNAGGLAKALGATNPTLLACIQDPPQGSIDLVLHMIGVLTEDALPPAPLVAACLQLHGSSKDPRALPAALPSVDRSVALRLMPSLLELPAEALHGAVRRLVTALPPQRAAAFSPPELLAALHTLDHSQDPKLLRNMMSAVTVCMSSPDLFPPESIAAAVSQLLTRVPLPQLFMRTVIQSVAAAPKLRPFVLGVLSQLVGKQIWNDATQWKGWIMCAQQLAPDSFPAWLHLPSAVLTQALPALPQSFKQQLAAFVASPACTVAVPPAVREALHAAAAEGAA